VSCDVSGRRGSTNCMAVPQLYGPGRVNFRASKYHNEAATVDHCVPSAEDHNEVSTPAVQSFTATTWYWESHEFWLTVLLSQTLTHYNTVSHRTAVFFGCRVILVFAWKVCLLLIRSARIHRPPWPPPVIRWSREYRLPWPRPVIRCVADSHSWL